MTLAPLGMETGAPLTVTSIISGAAGGAGAASAAAALVSDPARPREEDEAAAPAAAPPDRRATARSRAAGSMKEGGAWTGASERERGVCARGLRSLAAKKRE